MCYSVILDIWRQILDKIHANSGQESRRKQGNSGQFAAIPDNLRQVISVEVMEIWWVNSGHFAVILDNLQNNEIFFTFAEK